MSKAFKGGDTDDLKNTRKGVSIPTPTVMHLDAEQLDKIRASNLDDSSHSMESKKDSFKVATVSSMVGPRSKKNHNHSMDCSQAANGNVYIFAAMLFGWVFCILCWQFIDWNSFSLYRQ